MMASSVPVPQDVCSECGATLSDALRYCSTCQFDAGAPNVRACRTKENLKALTANYEASQIQANTNGCASEFHAFEEAIKTKSGVVISMPAGTARKLFEDPKSIYSNYEKLVGANVRRPTNSDNNRHRYAVGGILFGSYLNHIIYGALSLTETGLPTYGDVYCRLRSITVKKRTSFLVTNSYKFVSDHNIVAGSKLPVGFMACWDYRHNLVLTKLASSLSIGQTESDWQALLLQSDGKDRKNDNFIEAHIFEGFDGNAIESIMITSKKMSKETAMDARIALSKFNSLKGKTK
jgi:hypothetical protein